MISVIIPTLNESEHIERCLTALRKDFSGEIIVVDGGSEDDTTSRARPFATQVLSVKAGVSHQCNQAAERANGTLLFFVAADSIVPEGWSITIKDIMEDSKVVGGGFHLGIDHPGVAFRLIAWGGNRRAKREKVAFLDQGFFVRRFYWNELGGLPENSSLPIAKFCHSLKPHGDFVLAPDVTLTSPRKWEKHGVVKTTFEHLRLFREFKRRELV